LWDFNDWRKPQDLKSSFGKIIEYNITDKKKNILSLGHRNSQGLYFDRERKLIISTDHGPKGGDEVNLINANESAVNFGWPTSSYGEHYDAVPLSQKTKRVAPLYKSHIKHGFREPILVFTPSIGISQIIKNNNYLTTI
jgi:glucose/arabinose dehydrogenase